MHIFILITIILLFSDLAPRIFKRYKWRNKISVDICPNLMHWIFSIKIKKKYNKKLFIWINGIERYKNY